MTVYTSTQTNESTPRVNILKPFSGFQRTRLYVVGKVIRVKESIRHIDSESSITSLGVVYRTSNSRGMHRSIIHRNGSTAYFQGPCFRCSRKNSPLLGDSKTMRKFAIRPAKLPHIGGSQAPRQSEFNLRIMG